ncbi:MAG: DUF262 domain-containing protein [Bernardetiaceae bacterium]|nr:DUF262 domain-containing protein [Bernardetiaceae bacterium]
MKANENKIQAFLSKPDTQFVIPVYQRNYDWTQKQCKQLIDDILEVGRSEDLHAHFIGSIVYTHQGVYTTSDVQKLVVIDGQQRLTTLLLIYVVLRNVAKVVDDKRLVSKINKTYLMNEFANQEADKLKLRPTDNNLRVLNMLVDNKMEDYQLHSRLIDNYNYFVERITEENYKTIQQGLAKLMFVEISLERGKDDPQRIFESLNSTGLELSQADLIRNYILMGLEPSEQNRIYQTYWEVIEQLAKEVISHESKVSDFIRDYLTLENKKIPAKKRVYEEFKRKYPITYLQEDKQQYAKLEEELVNIKKMAKHYNKLLNPTNEPDKYIRKLLQYIHKLEVNVSFPFLMKVYDDYAENIIDKDTFIEVLNLVQSFTWRRFIVGLPTNALNKIFMNLYEKVKTQHYLFSIQKALLEKSGTQRFPRDKEIIEELKIKDFYNIQSKNRTYYLERLENFDNKEPVRIEGNNDITIEHIFPRNPSKNWQTDLSEEEFKFIEENYVNTIANLTLSGNNGKLSNKSFVEKRDLPKAGYADSRLWLNKYLAGLDKWDRKAIEKRCELITKRTLEIWKYPNIDIEVDTNPEVNIFEVEDPTGKQIEYAVFYSEKIVEKNVKDFYVKILQKLFELRPELFFNTSLAVDLKIVKNSQKEKLSQPAFFNGSYHVETHLRSSAKFDNLKKALTVFDLEDELLIKYAD